LRKLWRWVSFSTEAPLRIIGGLFTTNSDSWRTLETEHLSEWALCEGNLEGCVLLYWGPWRLSRRLWWGASLSIGILLGNIEGGLIYQGLWVMDEMGVCHPWGPIGEPGEGVHLPGTLRISWRALAMENLTPWELC
jgi:hypothetical protein